MIIMIAQPFKSRRIISQFPIDNQWVKGLQKGIFYPMILKSIKVNQRICRCWRHHFFQSVKPNMKETLDFF